MTDHGVQYSTADGNDLVEHEATYARFLAMAKWGTGGAVLVLVLMAVFLL